MVIYSAEVAIYTASHDFLTKMVFDGIKKFTGYRTCLNMFYDYSKILSLHLEWLFTPLKWLMVPLALGGTSDMISHLRRYK